MITIRIMRNGKGVILNNIIADELCSASGHSITLSPDENGYIELKSEYLLEFPDDKFLQLLHSGRTVALVQVLEYLTR